MSDHRLTSPDGSALPLPEPDISRYFRSGSLGLREGSFAVFSAGWRELCGYLEIRRQFVGGNWLRLVVAGGHIRAGKLSNVERELAESLV